MITDDELEDIKKRAKQAMINKHSYGYEVGGYTQYLNITNITLKPEIVVSLVDELINYRLHRRDKDD